jgi:hypothetical protein
MAATALSLMLVPKEGQAHNPDQGSSAFQLNDHEKALKDRTPLTGEGDARALTNIGIRYGQVRGVTPDFVAAHMWFSPIVATAPRPSSFLDAQAVRVAELTQSDRDELLARAREDASVLAPHLLEVGPDNIIPFYNFLRQAEGDKADQLFKEMFTDPNFQRTEGFWGWFEAPNKKPSQMQRDYLEKWREHHRNLEAKKEVQELMREWGSKIEDPPYYEDWMDYEDFQGLKEEYYYR